MQFSTRINKAIVDIRLRPRCAIQLFHFAAIHSALAIKRMPLSCARRYGLHGSVQFAIVKGVRLVSTCFPLP